MLQLSKMLTDKPVLSLRTGAQVGTAVGPVINPNNLKIEGWFVEDRFQKETLVVLAQDLRDIIPRGLVIDDADALSKPEDLLRLQETLRINFQLLGKSVVSNHHRHVGKVSDYAVDMESLFIQKLYVERSIFRSLTEGQLVIDRSQIIEITPRRIVVREPEQKVTAQSVVPANA